MLEENFRRAMLLSRGDLTVYLTRPISAWFIAAGALLIVFQLYAYARHLRKPKVASVEERMDA
jgi:TctA family transporter